MEVFKRFTFEASHRLLHLPKDHQCRQMHGHSYKVTIRASIRERCVARTYEDNKRSGNAGWVLDFGELGCIWKERCKPRLDHNYLNGVIEIGIPTAENIARWIWEQFNEALKGMYGLSVEVMETETAGAVFNGE